MKVEDDTFFFFSLSQNLKRTVLIEYVEVDAIMIHTDSGSSYQVDRLSE
jgi:hypothetical protein